MKKHRLFLTGIASSLFITTAAAANSSVLIEHPERMADVFLNDLSNAKKRIDLLLPDLQDRVLFEELQTIAKAKKKIRILLSPKEQGLKSWQCVPCITLEEEGIDIRFVDTRVDSGFAIVDGPRTRYSSGRFGKVLAFSGNVAAGDGRQLIVFSKTGDYVLNFQDEFNHLWSKSADFGDRARQRRAYQVRVPAVPGVFFSSANMIPVKTQSGWIMTPSLEEKSGVIENFIEGAVNYSMRSVDVSASSLKNPLLVNALIKAHERGVRIRLIVDRSEFGGTKGMNECSVSAVTQDLSRADECMAARGIQVTYRTRGSVTSSTNYMIIDRKLVLSGAVGSSRQEEFSGLRHLVVIRDSAHHTFSRNFSVQMSHALPVNKSFVKYKR